jgi:transposase-like protein
MEQNKMVRKYYTPEQKVKIIREHLENQVPLSEFSERYQVHMKRPKHT